MAEKLDLSTPYGGVAASTYFRVMRLVLDWDGARIQAKFIGDNNHTYVAEWGGATATQLMVALNKADLSTNSLHRRVINRALLDGKLPAGTISGSPD